MNFNDIISTIFSLETLLVLAFLMAIFSAYSIAFSNFTTTRKPKDYITSDFEDMSL